MPIYIEAKEIPSGDDGVLGSGEIKFGGRIQPRSRKDIWQGNVELEAIEETMRMLGVRGFGVNEVTLTIKLGQPLNVPERIISFITVRRGQPDFVIERGNSTREEKPHFLTRDLTLVRNPDAGLVNAVIISAPDKETDYERLLIFSNQTGSPDDFPQVKRRSGKRR